jgi:uncharacterized phage protein gp47/JayE
LATINTQTFAVLVQNAVTAVQGAARQLLDFTVGSVLRAIMEATAAMALWLQGIALQIAALARFSTSNGADADSWAADFGFTRLPAKAATGSVTFSRFTPTNQALVLVGTFIQTADGSQKYEVIPDEGQAAYDATQSAYVLPANVASVAATVESVTQSSAGNVAAGFINTLGSAIVGVDAVTNPLAFENGADSETDTDLRARFVLYIAGLSKATLAAIGSAIENIQQNVVFSITENENFDGTANRGYFYIVVDDGSGNPSADFLSTVSNAVEAVRPIGSTFGVFGPTLLTASVSMTLSVDVGYNRSDLVTLVNDALLAYISSLSIAQTLPYSRLAQIAYDVSPGIINVTDILLNGSTIDLVASSKQVIRAGSIVAV